MVRQAAELLTPGGILFAASCSHNVGVEEFAEAVARGLDDAGRAGRILRQAGAGPIILFIRCCLKAPTSNR